MDANITNGTKVIVTIQGEDMHATFVRAGALSWMSIVLLDGETEPTSIHNDNVKVDWTKVATGTRITYQQSADTVAAEASFDRSGIYGSLFISRTDTDGSIYHLTAAAHQLRLA